MSDRDPEQGAVFFPRDLLLTPIRFERGRRRIIKFSWLEAVRLDTFTAAQRLCLQAAPLKFALPAIDEAESFHLEVDAPQGMDVYEAEIVELGDDGEDAGSLAYAGERAQRVHLYPHDVRPGASSEARIWLLPVARGLIRSALLFSLSVSVMLAALFFLLPKDAEASAPSLLLALPGVVGLFLTRPGENAMTSRLLLGLRGVVSLVGFLPFAGALLLVLDVGPRVERTLWAAMTLVAGISAAVVAKAYVVSRRS